MRISYRVIATQAESGKFRSVLCGPLRLCVRYSVSHKAAKIRKGAIARHAHLGDNHRGNAKRTPTRQNNMINLSPEVFREAQTRVAPHVYHTPLLTSRMLSEESGFDIRLKAEIFQRTGSYKIRGPLNKFAHLSEEQRSCGVIC